MGVLYWPTYCEGETMCPRTYSLYSHKPTSGVCRRCHHAIRVFTMFLQSHYAHQTHTCVSKIRQDLMRVLVPMETMIKLEHEDLCVSKSVNSGQTCARDRGYFAAFEIRR